MLHLPNRAAAQCNQPEWERRTIAGLIGIGKGNSRWKEFNCPYYSMAQKPEPIPSPAQHESLWDQNHTWDLSI